MFSHIMFTYLMRITVLFNAVCLYDACLFSFVYIDRDFCIIIIYSNDLCFSALSLCY